jgi:hypothetical protein
MPVVTRTAGPQIRQWVPLGSQHQRSYRIIARTITTNQWEAPSRIDVRWTDVGRVGKSVATTLSPSPPIQRSILSPIQSRIYLTTEHQPPVLVRRASMGCNTIFKCNSPSLPPVVQGSPSPFRSKAHFSQALLNQYFQQQKQKQEQAKNSSSASGNDAVGGDQGAKRKKHPCPHDGCPNVYRQKSGLRYHLSHVSLGVLTWRPPPVEAKSSRVIKSYLLLNYR